jgi:hypothetical protein
MTFPVQASWPALADIYHQAFFLNLAPCAPALASSSNGMILRYAPR